jgi:hypothetical protein
MAPPSSQTVQAATKALRDEAKVWDDQSKTTGDIAPKVEGLRLSRIEAGLFQVIVTEYEKAIDVIVTRTGEGQQVMTNVADTLRTVADTYDQEESAGVHRMKHLY